MHVPETHGCSEAMRHRRQDGEADGEEPRHASAVVDVVPRHVCETEQGDDAVRDGDRAERLDAPDALVQPFPRGRRAKQRAVDVDDGRVKPPEGQTAADHDDRDERDDEQYDRDEEVKVHDNPRGWSVTRQA